MSILRPECYHLSPAVGLAFSAGGSHLLSRLYDLQPAVAMADGARTQSFDGKEVRWKGCASGALARSLFHRNHADEPLRPTNNRSLPAAHLSPSITASIAGLAWSRPGSAVVHASLRACVCSETGQPLPALAKETGVTIARFERLVEQVAQADDEPEAPLPHLGTSMLMRLLWQRSTTSQEIWTYLSLLHLHHGVMLFDESSSSSSSTATTAATTAATAAATATAAAATTSSATTATIATNAGQLSEAELTRFSEGASSSRPRSFHPGELGGSAVLRAAQKLLRPTAQQQHDRLSAAEAFEVLAAALALGGSRAAPLNQGRYDYRGQGNVADCAEMVARELLNELLWDPAAQSFDSSRLPAGANAALKAFYAPGGPADRAPCASSSSGGGGSTGSSNEHGGTQQWHAGAPVYTAAADAWFQLSSGLAGVHYLSGIPSMRYECVAGSIPRMLGVLPLPLASRLSPLASASAAVTDLRTTDLSLASRLAPTCDAVVHCLGVLLGEPDVRTPSDFEVMWTKRVQPGRRLGLKTNLAGDRMYLMEPSEESDGGDVCTLECVMSQRLNHAFTIHHHKVPSWMAEIGDMALEHWPRNGGDHHGTLPRLALMPALLQPRLSFAEPQTQRPPLLEPDGPWRRLGLLSTAASDDNGVGRSLLRLLNGPSRTEEGHADERLAARVLAASVSGLAGADDALILALAQHPRVHAVPALLHAMTLHPPLAAPASLLSGAYSVWARAVLTSPLRCLRLSAQAVLVGLGGR